MKKNNKHILIVCSWLDHRKNIGSFFIEQANIFRKDFEITMVCFLPFGIKEFFLFKKFFFISEFEEQDKRPRILYVNYFGSKIWGNLISGLVKKIVIQKFYSFFKKKYSKVDLIHLQGLLPGFEYVYYLNKFFKIKYINTEHNQLSFLKEQPQIKQKVKEFLENSSFNLVVSNDKIRQFYTNRLFFDFKNVGNMLNSFFNIEGEKEFLIKESKYFKVITVGAFSKIKDQATIFKALKDLEFVVSHEKIEFTWVGYNSWGTNNTKSVIELVESFNFEKIKINLIPLASREEVKIYLLQSDVFVFSSVVEGMPVSVLEALGCGLPVISTLCGGVEEILNEKNGRLIPIFDYKKMAEYLSQIYFGEIVFDRIQISNLANYLYGSDAFKNKILHFYTSVLDQGKIK